MNQFTWQRLPLIERVHWLRYMLPPVLVIIVVIYQLGVARRLADDFGHPVHYAVEIGFYSLVGPAVSWVTLVWVERRLKEQESLERQVRVRTQQLASLTAASADAILSLDGKGRIASWNQGAAQLFGYSEEGIVGQPLSLLLPQADQLGHQEMGHRFETAARTRNGRSITVDLTQTQLDASSEEMPVGLIIMRDVTARHTREAVLEEERARIARDLHDGVAQTLYFLALKADMARQQIEQDPEQAISNLRELGQKTRQVIREVRRTIFALRPLNWSNGGFLSALRQLVTGFGEQVGWQTTISMSDHLSIPPTLEPVVYRLVQESLNNVAKHAEADRIWVTLQVGEDQPSLCLTVRDNGRGFDPQVTEGYGMGLKQMAGRAQMAGGLFQVKSNPGLGTTITALLPLKDKPHG